MEKNELVSLQKAYFQKGETRSLAFRKNALLKLRNAILRHESQILEALRQDLNKPEGESYLTEIGFVLVELNEAIRHLSRWSRPRRVRTALAQFPGKSRIYHEPYGVVLILSPWNYPFQLTFSPLIGALAAGNCAVVKPSAYAPAVSLVIASILHACFEPQHVEVVFGGRTENQDLLRQKFDYLFFTGSALVGKEVMRAASDHLTPVTLELGGKSPCIVEASADLPLAAKRIVFGKFLNAGQTCVAPDYLLLQESLQEPFFEALQAQIHSLFGEFPFENPDFPKIINKHHFQRLLALMESGTVLIGGKTSAERLVIEPTVLTDVLPSSPIMQEEIFGPILPVIPFANLENALEQIACRPKPLALYLFTRDKEIQRRVLSRLSFGGGCLNDTILHLASPCLPFGGVGESGMGQYHGYASFTTFSHQKSVLHKAAWPDLSLRYPPYTEKKMKRIKRFFR